MYCTACVNTEDKSWQTMNIFRETQEQQLPDRKWLCMNARVQASQQSHLIPYDPRKTTVYKESDNGKKEISGWSLSKT